MTTFLAPCLKCASAVSLVRLMPGREGGRRRKVNISIYERDTETGTDCLNPPLPWSFYPFLPPALVPRIRTSGIDDIVGADGVPLDVPGLHLLEASHLLPVCRLMKVGGG